jgi:chromosome segregation ATPase
MDDHRYIAVEEALRALKASTEALHATIAPVRGEVGTLQSTVNSVQREMATLQTTVNSVQRDMAVLQGDVTKVKGDIASQHGSIIHLQADVASLHDKFDIFTEHYAKKVEVEAVRVDFYKAIETQTWKLITWMTFVCSGMTAAVYFIARNVH